MKFLLPLLLAAPAVMGRACPPRNPNKTGSAPAPTRDNSVISTKVPQADVSPIPEVDLSSKPANDDVKTNVPSVPQSTLVTSITPTTSSKPKSSTQPKPSSGSGSGSGSGSSGGSQGDLGGESVSGSSTFYGGNLDGGNCLFYKYTLPSGMYGTAFSGQPWDNAANCGACIEITGPTGTITAMIVDQCPECTKGHLDLFPDAFTAVGGTDGIVDTTYKFVKCGITSPITVRNKVGTSQHWFSMQVVNANEPIKSLEVSTDGGSTWKSTTRKDYNFFEEPSGFGTTSVDVKVTSTTGKSIIVSGVGVESETEFKGDSNF